MDTTRKTLGQQIDEMPAGGMDNLPLTPREIDVLRLLASGCTYTQIADRLGVSLHTVASHVKNLYRKLDVHSARAAVWRAFQLRVLLNPEAV